MSRMRQLKLGVCPIGKFVFSHEDAMKLKQQLFDKLREWDVTFVDIDAVLPDGMVRDQAHVEPVVRHFREQQVEALFLPHCNFGTEGAAGMIAHHLGLPTLLWGPRDEAPLPDGTRLRDSLCGTLASSKVLQTMGVRFSYIPNSRIEGDRFRRGFDTFLRAARVAKTLRTLRVGMVGQRIDFFWSTIVSEVDLLQRFGVEVLPIDLSLALDRVKQRAGDNAALYREELAAHREWVAFDGFDADEPILNNYALRDELLEQAEAHGLDGFVLQTFSSLQEALGMTPSFGVSLLNDLGYPVGPESDVHGAITSAILEAAIGRDEPSFLPDITIRHPDNDNAVLLWHFEAPLSLRRPGTKVKTGTPWILKGLPPGLVHFRLKDGPLTLARFDGNAERGYRLGFGEGHTVEGPYTQEYYAWMEVNDWPRWETQIAEGPYIHHCSCVFDHCTHVLAEAARFVPGLEIERFGA